MLIAIMLFGFVFGFFMQHARVNRNDVIIGMAVMEDWIAANQETLALAQKRYKSLDFEAFLELLLCFAGADGHEPGHPAQDQVVGQGVEEGLEPAYETGGDQPWGISGTAHSGSRSVQAGDIANNQVS